MPRHYGHWKRQEILGPSGAPPGLVRSMEGSLVYELQQLLPTLMGARDYRGAAAVLSVIYKHFMSNPAACITTSLEILRRLPDTTPTLVEFYQTLLDWQSAHVSSDVIIRERFLLFLLQGDLQEAYAYYKEHMQEEVLQQDVHVVAGFGMVCYWLLFREDQDLRDEYIASSPSAATGWLSQETQFPVQHIVGTATLFQEAVVSFRRAMTLSPESAVFVEYYVQVLVMKNDIELAADYLEHFYHLHPTEPHACRMLFRFFHQYFPESIACRVDICVRWNTLDPSTVEPLHALLDAFENGHVVTQEDLVTCLCHSLDHCGSAMYQRLHPDTSLWMWQQLANLLGPVSLPALSGQVASCFDSRQWWRRVYLPPTTQANELTRVQVLQTVVAVRVWGADALPAPLRLSDLVGSPDEDIRAIANRFHLDALDIAPTPPPSTDPIVRSWTTQLTWRPSRGQLRTPHVLKRPQVLTSFDLDDAVQVHEVAEDAAPPPRRIRRPLDADVVRPTESTHQHPYLWLMSQRSGRTNPWHIDVAATISHAVEPPREASVLVDVADTPVLTDKDCVAVATEDELLLSPGQERNVTSRHILTSYLYKNLPVPMTNSQTNVIIRALRRKHPFLPQHRVPARFLHWIQAYMTRRGVRATATKCRLYLEAQWRRHGGRCRGLPSIHAVEAAMEYFKVNPVILPRRIRDRYRTFVANHGTHVSLVDLCREFYSQLEARHPPNLPFFSVVYATTKQWMTIFGIDRGIRAIVPCFPPTVLNRDDDDDAWTKALNEEPPVAESSFVTPANERFLSSIKDWLLAESPITNAKLVYFMHMHFDATCPDFPSPPSVLNAMIDYVRVQLHAEHADVPSMEDSIYYSRPKLVFKPKYRKYLEACVVRHQHVPFEEIVRIMLDKSLLPPAKDSAPTLRELHGWWRAAVNDLLAAGLGLGTPVPCTIEEADVARVAPQEDSLGDIETAKKKLPKMLNLPEDMEVFAI